MNNQELEVILNQTFSGLTLFYRDTNLDENLISKYELGQIIMERGFTDMTYKGGGLSSNLRYLIASSSGKDLSIFNPDSKNYGHIVLTSNAYFKILDIYKIENKTQIFLLNIPEESKEIFKKIKTNIEEEIIQKARKNFEDKINVALIEELESKEWKERTEFPIGMNDKGEFFYDDFKQVTKTNVEKTITEQPKNSTTSNNKPWWKFW